jgi:hypothetical protein
VAGEKADGQTKHGSGASWNLSVWVVTISLPGNHTCLSGPKRRQLAWVKKIPIAGRTMKSLRFLGYDLFTNWSPKGDLVVEFRLHPAEQASEDGRDCLGIQPPNTFDGAVKAFSLKERRRFDIRQLIRKQVQAHKTEANGFA